MVLPGPTVRTKPITKEEEFLKEFKTLIKELAKVVMDTTLSKSEFDRAKKLHSATEELDKPPDLGDSVYY